MPKKNFKTHDNISREVNKFVKFRKDHKINGWEMLLDQKIDYLIEKLKSEEPAERIYAINALTEIPINGPIAKELCSLVIDPDSGVRNIITDQLKLSDSPAIPFNLVKYISYPDLAVKNLAGEILLGLGSISIDSMLDYVPKGDDDDKKFIIDLLGLIGDKCAEDKIIELLNSTENDNVFLACTEALGNLGSEKATPYLTSFYTANEVFKPIIIEALGKIGSGESLEFILLKYEEEENELIKFAIIESLGLVGDEKTFFFLLSELNEADQALTGPIIKSIYSLKTRFGFDIPFDERTKNQVLHIVTESDAEYRKIAARLLSVFNEKEILAAYLKILGEDAETDEIILNNFLESPSLFLSLSADFLVHKPENIVPLLKSLKEVVQVKEAEFKEFISPLLLRDTIDSLSGYLKDANEEVRLICIEILFLLDRDTAVLFFDDVADDQSFWNRLRLMEILEEVDNPKVMEILKMLLNDPEEMIRERAEYSLSIRNANGMKIDADK